MKNIIELTEEQQTWLLRFLNREWDLEVEYQWTNNQDTSYLEDMLDVYIALLGKPRHWIEAYSFRDDVENKIKELDELKGINK